MKILTLGFFVAVVLGFSACSTVSSSDSSSNVRAESDRARANKFKPKNFGQALDVQDLAVNDLVRHLNGDEAEALKFDSYINCANHPICYKSSNDLLKPGRTQMANDLDHGGVYASVTEEGVSYYLSFRKVERADALIITISNQNREPRIPYDYQLLDCYGDGVVDAKRIVDMKNVSDPLDFQMSRNLDLYEICNNLKPSDIKLETDWQSHYTGALRVLASRFEQ